jgi:hypothetical protein
MLTLCLPSGTIVGTSLTCACSCFIASATGSPTMLTSISQTTSLTPSPTGSSTTLWGPTTCPPPYTVTQTFPLIIVTSISSSTCPLAPTITSTASISLNAFITTDTITVTSTATSIAACNDGFYQCENNAPIDSGQVGFLSSLEMHTPIEEGAAE